MKRRVSEKRTRDFSKRPKSKKKRRTVEEREEEVENEQRTGKLTFSNSNSSFSSLNSVSSEDLNSDVGIIDVLDVSSFSVLDIRSILNNRIDLLIEESKIHKNKRVEDGEIILDKSTEETGDGDQDEDEDGYSDNVGRYKIGETEISDIIISLKTQKSNVYKDPTFRTKREKHILKMFKKILESKNMLDRMYQETLKKKPIFYRMTYKKCLEVYNQWNKLFLNDYYRGLCLSRNITMPGDDSDSVHVCLLIMKLHFVLHNQKSIIRLSSTNMNTDIGFSDKNFWYEQSDVNNGADTFFNSSDHISRIGLFNNLPKPYETSMETLKFLHPSLIFEKIKKKKIIKYNLRETMDVCKLLVQHVHIDYFLYVREKYRIHILYFIEIIIMRLGMFMILKHKKDVLNEGSLRVRVGRKHYSPNMRLLKTITHYVYVLKSRFCKKLNFKNLRSMKIKLKVPNTRFNTRGQGRMDTSVSVCDDDDDDDEGEGDLRIPTQRMKTVTFEPSDGIELVEKKLKKYFSSRIAIHEDILSPFYDKLLIDIIVLCSHNELHTIKLLSNANAGDFFTRVVNTSDAQRDVIKQYLPEVYEVITMYSNDFQESLGKLEAGNIADKRGVSQKATKKVYSRNIEYFMKHRFHRVKDFSKALVEMKSVYKDDPLISTNIINDLLKHKKFQSSYLYPFTCIRNVLYLKSLNMWIKENFKTTGFLYDNIIWYDEICNDSNTYRKKVIIAKKNTPIFIQTSHMRFDVLYNNTIYYANHLISKAIVIWMTILYVKCDGKLYINDNQINIKAKLGEFISTRIRNRFNLLDGSNITSRQRYNEFLKTGYVHSAGDQGSNNTTNGKKFNPINMLSGRNYKVLEGKPTYKTKQNDSIDVFNSLSDKKEEKAKGTNRFEMSNLTKLMEMRERKLSNKNERLKDSKRGTGMFNDLEE